MDDKENKEINNKPDTEEEKIYTDGNQVKEEDPFSDEKLFPRGDDDEYNDLIGYGDGQFRDYMNHGRTK